MYGKLYGILYNLIFITPIALEIASFTIQLIYPIYKWFQCSLYFCYLCRANLMAIDYEPEISSMEQFLTQSKRQVNMNNRNK